MIKDELPNSNNADVNNNEMSVKECVIADESKRKNATICDI